MVPNLNIELANSYFRLGFKFTLIYIYPKQEKKKT